MKIEQRNINNVIKLASIAIGGIGLAFFCNPQRLGQFIEPRLQHIYEALINGSNEKDEVGRLLAIVPDGQEQQVAGMMNYAVASGPKKRRSLSGKVCVKPHILMYEVLKSAASIYRRQVNNGDNT
ncbi:hypothetical protein HY214_05300 [Candidatus Roizmanbacteria bacterium]|nr:hypothetical protein [Candidatus Roizmanbacteria bacterium]